MPYAVRCDVRQRRGRDAERLFVGKWRGVGVSEMWRRIQRLGIYPYFDRVASKSKSVDGLSHGRREGPWVQVVQARLPVNLPDLLTDAGR